MSVRVRRVRLRLFTGRVYAFKIRCCGLSPPVSSQIKWSENLSTKVSVKLNLASQPFRNRALPWTITAVVTVASLLALVLIVRASMKTNAEASQVERDVNNLRQQARDLQLHAEEIKEALTPEQLQTLQAAHTLVDRKRFSWSRLFADLEASLPQNVRVTRINVRDVALRGNQTYAELELAVAGRSDADVTHMIGEMERAGIFQAEPMSQDAQNDKNQGGTEWTLRVLYRPRAGVPVAPDGNTRIAATSTAPAATSNGGAR
jgi:Tfp pilus assembly protein PilN